MGSCLSCCDAETAIQPTETTFLKRSIQKSPTPFLNARKRRRAKQQLRSRRYAVAIKE
jgi:hypothetical protein